jgi:transposase InsO family protein
LRPTTGPLIARSVALLAEGFVKTFKRDYVYVGDVDSARAVLLALPRWFADYNENAPHKGLTMLSPRQFRRAQST